MEEHSSQRRQFPFDMPTHVKRTDVQVLLQRSDTEPGHVILGMGVDGNMITVTMTPQEWEQFLKHAATVTVQALEDLAAIAQAETLDKQKKGSSGDYN